MEHKENPASVGADSGAQGDNSNSLRERHLTTPLGRRATEFMPDFTLSAINPYSNGTFELAATGTKAIIMAVDESGDAIDDVAWYPGQPGKWWLRHGVATVLGEDAIDAARWHGESVLLVATPADWIKARGEAACILDWSADVYGPLSLAPGVRCATVALAGQLRKAISRPRLNITIAGVRRYAA
jgi:hypothetical protein